MFINGTQFNAEISEIISTLKTELANNGIQRFAKTFDSGDDFMLCCPYHKGGQERRPSAGIRKSDGMFHCLCCDKTVSIDELIANCLGYNDPIIGYRWLVQRFATVQVEERKDIELDLSRENNNSSYTQFFVPEEELDTYRYYHPYMYTRCLTDEVIKQFDIGYDKKTDSITFPVRYWGIANFGRCMFVAKRNVKYKRFDLPNNIEKPLYGLYEIWVIMQSLPMGKFLDNIYICEGLFDCLRLWCNGKIAVAGFGCLFSEYQISLLEGLPTRKLISALDNDKAGREATAKLKRRIKNKLITEVILPEGRKDIGECTDEEIQNLKEVF